MKKTADFYSPSTVIEMQPLSHSTHQTREADRVASVDHSHSPSHASSQRSPKGTALSSRPSALASFDSSDTWASCNPFPSAVDLSTSTPVEPAANRPMGGSSVDLKNTEHVVDHPHYAVDDAGGYGDDDEAASAEQHKSTKVRTDFVGRAEGFNARHGRKDPADFNWIFIRRSTNPGRDSRKRPRPRTSRVHPPGRTRPPRNSAKPNLRS